MNPLIEIEFDPAVGNVAAARVVSLTASEIRFLPLDGNGALINPNGVSVAENTAEGMPTEQTIKTDVEAAILSWEQF